MIPYSSTTTDDKPMAKMNALANAFDRPMTDSVNADIGRLTQTLQTTLSLSLLIDLFHQGIQHRVALDGLDYTHADLPFERKLGRRARNSCHYNLMLAETSLGEIRFYRGKKFTAEDIQNLEDFLCCLLYPLRNALLYQDAVAMAQKDPLTGISNRSALTEALHTEIGLAHRHGGELSMIVFDIDHFKSINDTYGHARGDIAIKAVVEAAQNCARNTDTLYRFGGEEFVMLLRNTDAKGANLLAERIRATVARLKIGGNPSPITLTVSAGATSLHADDNADSFFDRADQALYQAKKAGRNCVRNAA